MHATRSAALIGLLATAGCAGHPPPAAQRAPAVCAQSGMASWYHPTAGHVPPADGHPASPDGLTAAHPFLPFGTAARVTDIGTGRSVTVRIEDRGPFVGGRIIDLSAAAARQLGMRTDGVTRVRLLATPGHAGPVPPGSGSGAAPVCTPETFGAPPA